MANPNQVAGRAKVKIDGALLPTAGDTTLDLGGDGREGVEGDYEAGAFKVSTKQAKLETTILSKGSISAAAIGKMSDVTLSVEFDNGKSYVIRHAWSEGPPQMTTSDGKMKPVFYGPPAEEVA
jgi:hypothetical protein